MIFAYQELANGNDPENTEPPTVTSSPSKIRIIVQTIVIHAAVIVFFVFATLQYLKSRKHVIKLVLRIAMI